MVEGTAPRLLLHERTMPDGSREKTWLELSDGSLVLRVDARAPAQIPVAFLEAVMKRYGKPLADDVELSGPRLELEGGRSVCVLRHRARYDVIARDFLVYTAPGQDSLAELAASVTAALSYLAGC